MYNLILYLYLYFKIVTFKEKNFLGSLQEYYQQISTFTQNCIYNTVFFCFKFYI